MLGRSRHFRFGAILGPLMPFFATLLALLIGAAMLSALGANPLKAYSALIDGAFGSLNALADTVVRATPLLFVGLGICIFLDAHPDGKALITDPPNIARALDGKSGTWIEA